MNHVSQSPVTSRKRGFTLLELAIVLGIVGALVAGLFQLTASSSRQVNDQITAQQMQQYIKGTKNWLSGARVDPDGTSITGYLTDGTASGTVNLTVNNNQNVTDSVIGFNRSTLSRVAPNGGTYTVVLARLPNIGTDTHAYYAISISVIGGKEYSRVSLGAIASYIGAEGATTYPAGLTADDALTTACNENTQDTIRGAFGGLCLPKSTFSNGGFANLAPATLSFQSMADLGISEDRYLWRVTANPVTYNAMLTNLTMSSGTNLIFAGTNPVSLSNDTANASGGVTTNNGGLNLGTGNLTGTGYIGLGGASGVGGGIYLNGGDVVTNGGSLSLGTGNVAGATDGSFSGTLSAGTFIYTSDRNAKKDIVPLHGQLNELLQINGVSYRLKSNDKKSLGVIAQDVEKVYPELVEEHNGVKGVNYMGLIGPLIESVRELKQQNDELRARIEKLEQAKK